MQTFCSSKPLIMLYTLTHMLPPVRLLFRGCRLLMQEKSYTDSFQEVNIVWHVKLHHYFDSRETFFNMPVVALVCNTRTDAFTPKTSTTHTVIVLLI